MRTLHRYLLREIVATLLMTVAVFTFVLLLGNVLKEILSLLVNRQATLTAVALAIGLLIPYVLVFALPMGVLTATLLVFGRASAEHELTAIRANGVSLIALTTPIFLMSTGLCVLSAAINMQIAPQCRVAYKRLLTDMGLARANNLLPEKVFIKDFPGHIVYVGNVDGSRLKDLLVYKLDDNGQLKGYLRATEGKLRVNKTNNSITLQATDAWWVELVEEEGRFRSQPMFTGQAEFTPTNSLGAAEEKVKLSDMTIFQLWDQLRDLELRLNAPTRVGKLSKIQLAEMMREVEKQREEITLPVKMQIHRQFAFSFACLAFTLVGIPLGIRAHRKETTFGIAAALLLVLAYYSFFILGHALDDHPNLYPHLILWLPNFIFEAVGIVLLWRANRGF